MKVTAIGRGQATDALPAGFFATVPVFELVDALKERYQFRAIPTGQELLNPQPNQPANFIWGKRDIEGRIIAVENLQVLTYANLSTTITVITHTSTSDADLVLDDLSQWVSSAFSLRPKAIFPRNYLSQIEFILEAPLSKRLDFLKPVADVVTRLMHSYGFTGCPQYEPTSLFLFFDNTQLTNPPTLAGAFSVDRRAGASFEENRFFSQAFLKTEDHVVVLEEFERTLHE